MNKDQIREANRKRNTAIHDAAAATPEFLTADNIGDAIYALVPVVANALSTVADQFRARAEEYAAKPRGASTAGKLKYAETELRGIVVSLLADGIDEQRSAPKASVAGTAMTVPSSMGAHGDRAPEAVLCGLTDKLDEAGTSPCLLSSEHLREGSSHQGRTRRWPFMLGDLERWELLQMGSVDLRPAQLAADSGYVDDGRIAALPDASMGVTDACVCPRDQRVYCHHDPCFGGADIEGFHPRDVFAPANIEIPAIWGPDSFAEALIDIPEIFPPEHVGPDLSEMRPFVLDPTTALPSPKHRSVSQIETYNACGMKYRLRYRDGLRGKPAWFLVGGTMFHRAVEEICKRLPTLSAFGALTEQGWNPDLDKLWTFFYEDEINAVQVSSGVKAEDWRVSKGEDAAWWRVNGAEMLRTYYAWHCGRLRDGWEIAKDPYGGLIVEYEFTLNVDGVPVKGYIDQAWWSVRRGVVEVGDLKAGASTPGDSFQLGMYGNALVDLFARAQDAMTLDASNVTAGFYNARKGELKLTERPVLEMHPRAEIAYQVGTMDAAERAGVYIANTQTNYGGCKSCEFKRACPIGVRR
jgi:hypothetical protein